MYQRYQKVKGRVENPKTFYYMAVAFSVLARAHAHLVNEAIYTQVRMRTT